MAGEQSKVGDDSLGHTSTEEWREEAGGRRWQRAKPRRLREDHTRAVGAIR